MSGGPRVGLGALLSLLALAGIACGLLADSEPTAAPTEVLSPTVTVESTTAPQIQFNFVDYSDEQLGLSLRYPQGWVREEEPESLIIASEPALLASERFEREGAGVIITVASRADLPGETLEAAFAEAVKRFELGDQGAYLEEPRKTRIGGQDAVVATFEQMSDEPNGNRLVYRVALLQGDSRVALVVGVTLQQLQQQFSAALETIINSVQLHDPQTTNVTPSQGTLEYGQTVRDTILAGVASAWTFIGVEGERIDILVRPLAEGLDITVDVLNSSHTSILDSGPVDQAFGTETIRGLTVPLSDEYTIVVRGFGRSSGDYEIRLSESGAASAAPSLAVGESMEGSLETNEQDDYAFRSADGAPITVLVEPEGELDVVVELLGPEDGVIVQEDSSYGREQLPFSPQTNREYIIRVRGFAGDGGQYVITVQAGTVISDAGTTITVSDHLAQSFEDGHDYPFEAAQGDTVQAIVQPEGELDVVVEVWDDDADQLEQRLDETYGREEVGFTTVEAGNYFVKVLGFEGQTGSYTIDLIGPPSTIFELAIGDHVQANFGQASRIEYHLRMDPDETVAVRVQPDPETDVVVEVLDSAGSVLANLDDGFRGEVEMLRFTAPPDSAEREIYTLRVRDFFAEGGGTFTLTFQEG